MANSWAIGFYTGRPSVWLESGERTRLARWRNQLSSGISYVAEPRSELRRQKNPNVSFVADIGDETERREIEPNSGDCTNELADENEGLEPLTDAFGILKNGEAVVPERLEQPNAVVAVEPMVPRIGPLAKEPLPRRRSGK